MVKYAKRIELHSVTAGWDGDLPRGARFILSQAMGRKIGLIAWGDFRRLMRRYATGLNFENDAATIVEAQAAANAVLKATDKLLGAIDVADDDRMDRLVSNRSGEKWEVVHDHESNFDRDQKRMVTDIAELFSDPDDPSSVELGTDLGWRLVGGWAGAGRLVRPDPARDFVVMLQEFQQAFGLVAKDLKMEAKHAVPRIPAWMQFVIDVREWATKHGHPTWAGNNDAHGERPHGPIVYLIKAVNDLLPVQYRRQPIKDISWSSAILDAWQEYDAGAKKLAKLSGQNP